MKAWPRSWPATTDEARSLQEQLRAKVVAEDRLGPVRLVAGVDAHHEAETRLTWAAAAALHLSGLEPAEEALACRRTAFPYVPGLLSFREAPAALDALGRLSATPDMLLVDGHGLAHPRRFGLACHIGLLAEIPAIGVAKSRLVGAYDEPGEARGDWAPLIHRGEVVGAVLRTRSGTRPVFVSVGHRVGLATAIDFALQCAPRYRLPEPIRRADRLSRQHPPDKG